MDMLLRSQERPEQNMVFGMRRRQEMTPYRKQYLANLKKRKEAPKKKAWEDYMRGLHDPEFRALEEKAFGKLRWAGDRVERWNELKQGWVPDVAPTPWTPWNPAEQRVETKKREDIEKQVAEAEATMERVGKFISSTRWRG